jgi:hypothetical protein
MEEESGRDEGFKFSDKRRFTTEGETRQGDETREKESEQKGFQSVDGEKETTRPQPLPPMDFSTFVLSLAETALFHLGLIRVPGSEEVKKDLHAARQTIDIIALLEEKTRGNLTDQEKNIITETLFQLRMAFVDASK